MTQQEIIAGNKLIAEFMGIKLHGGGTSVFDWVEPSPLDADKLAYHSSWDWLMPVVEKIEATKCRTTNDYEDIIINGCSCLISVHDFHLSTVEVTKILAVWKAVVEFIKWDSSQK